MNLANENSINERILNGNFPDCQIVRAPKREVLINDVSNKERRGHSIIKQYPIPLHLALQTYLHNFSIYENDCDTEVLWQDINFLINTFINPETINKENKFAQRAIRLFPAVTIFDKALWGAIVNAHAAALIDNEEWINVAYAWIRLLRVSQQKELASRKTIDLSKVNETTPILDILYKPWDDISDPCFIEISEYEFLSLEKLTSEQEKLQKECQRIVDEGNKIGDRTEKEWVQFLNILNDIRTQESIVVDQICAPLSVSEKLHVIVDYKRTINQINDGSYLLQDTTIPLEPLFIAIEERFKNAPAHCFVSDCDGSSFCLRSEAIELVRNPTTFNYLFIAYHHFRMDPTKDNALQFFTLALHCLRRNLGLGPACCVREITIDTIVSSFYDTVNRFWQEKSTAISQLSFNKLQQDAIINSESSRETLLINRMCNKLYTTVREALIELDPSLSTVKTLNDVQTLALEVNATYYKKLGVQSNNFDQYLDNDYDKELARLLVISLNIIYLFCDALKIIADESDYHDFVENLDTIDECREGLQHIHSDVARKVYTREVNLSKHRREAGIDATPLANKESKEERLRNSTFFSILLKYLSQLGKGIRKYSIDDLLAINRRFRTEMLLCPTFINKEEQIKELENISNDICNSLVEAFETASPKQLLKEKQAILNQLGAESRFLPESALKTLATAECLFHKYASPQYQEAGFDYSSISALYYQAFEDAYNTIIWREYAARMDSVRIGYQSLAEYLSCCKANNAAIGISSALGYLPKKSIYKYIKDANDKSPAYFHKAITFEIFYEALKGITGNEKLDKLCDYFAEITGFSNSQSMLADESFRSQLVRFTNKVYRKKDNRNEASHGGNVITFRMCENDKKAVLFDLENIRKDSISLIQLLLILVRNSKTLPPYKH